LGAILTLTRKNPSKQNINNGFRVNEPVLSPVGNTANSSMPSAATDGVRCLTVARA